MYPLIGRYDVLLEGVEYGGWVVHRHEVYGLIIQVGLIVDAEWSIEPVVPITLPMEWTTARDCVLELYDCLWQGEFSGMHDLLTRPRPRGL